MSLLSQRRKSLQVEHVGANGQAVKVEATVNEALDDPHRLARLFTDKYEAQGLCTLVGWQGGFYAWDGAAYVAKPGDELRAEAVATIKKEFDRANLEDVRQWTLTSGGVGAKYTPKPVVQQVTTPLSSNVMQAILSARLLPASVKRLTWLGEGKAPLPASEVLACRNGLLHLPTGRFIPPSPRFFTTNALDFAYDPKAPAPEHWLEFLRQLWADDEEAIGTLQEWFGYCLLPDTRQQKIVLMVGPKRSGKGTIARINRGLVGVSNTAGPTLASLGTNFGLQALIDKTVATISDARLSRQTDIAIVTERLLSISGEDAVTIDRKHKEAITTTLPTRFMVLTNELPRLADASGALASRMIVLRLTESFFGREDTALTDKLMTELPGILLWAVEGWRRLRKRGHFVQPESGKELVEALADLTSPISAFLRDRCEVGPEHRVLPAEVYNAWCDWCKQAGREHPGSAPVFARDLHAALPSLKTKQVRVKVPKTLKSVAIRFHFGLKLL